MAIFKSLAYQNFPAYTTKVRQNLSSLDIDTTQCNAKNDKRMPSRSRTSFTDKNDRPQLSGRLEEAKDGLEITAVKKFTAAIRHLSIM